MFYKLITTYTYTNVYRRNSEKSGAFDECQVVQRLQDQQDYIQVFIMVGSEYEIDGCCYLSGVEEHDGVPGVDTDQPGEGDGLSEGPAGPAEGAVAQHERHQSGGGGGSGGGPAAPQSQE